MQLLPDAFRTCRQRNNKPKFLGKLASSKIGKLVGFGAASGHRGLVQFVLISQPPENLVHSR
ncbi:MAG: hypothetical protein CXZ00_08390 [Acidobacteria bacterium]|nr:MAG: hypothetical protein CXZ00_08390 [Acidobacteriota bacterium]